MANRTVADVLADLDKGMPGPWSVEMDKNEDGTPWISVVCALPDSPGDTNVVCTMGTSGGDVWGGYRGEEADAMLIAAAPDLLAACQAFLDAPVALTAAHVRTAEMIRAAVAKARGDK